MNLPAGQIHALFNKAIKKFKNFFRQLYETDIEKSLPKMKEIQMQPLK